MKFYDTVDTASLNALVKGNAPDYASNATAKTVNDPRFIADLRQFYADRGTTYDNDTDLVAAWKSDNRWREANIVSAGKALINSATQSPDKSAREARIQQVWDAVPYFFQEGGSGIAGLAENLTAGVADPLNLIPGSKAFVAARAASTAAEMAGKNAVTAGIAQGAKTGAVWDAGVNAASAVPMSLLDQGRASTLGLQDGISAKRLAEDVAVGGLLGGVVGGGIGAVTGGFASRGAEARASSFLQRGLTPDDISGLSAKEFDAALEAANAPTPASPAPDPATARADALKTAAEEKELRINEMRADLRDQIDGANENLIAARASNDATAIEEAAKARDEAARDISNFHVFTQADVQVSRLRKVAEGLISEIDPVSQEQGRALLQKAADLESLYRVVIDRGGVDEMDKFLVQLRDAQTKASLKPEAEAAAAHQTATQQAAAQKAASEQAPTTPEAPEQAAPGTEAATVEAAAVESEATPKRGAKKAATATETVTPEQAAPEAATVAPEAGLAEQLAEMVKVQKATLDGLSQQLKQTGADSQQAGKIRDAIKTQKGTLDDLSKKLNESTGITAPETTAPAAPPAPEAVSPRVLDARVVREALKQGVDPYKIAKERPTVDDVSTMAKEMKAKGIEYDADLDVARKGMEGVLEEYDRLLEPFGTDVKLAFLGNKQIMSSIFGSDQRTSASADKISRFYEALATADDELEMAANKGGRGPKQTATEKASIFTGAGVNVGQRVLNAKKSTDAGEAIYDWKFGKIQNILQRGRNTSDGGSILPGMKGADDGATRATVQKTFMEFPDKRFFNREEALIAARNTTTINARLDKEADLGAQRGAAARAAAFEVDLKNAKDANSDDLAALLNSADPKDRLLGARYRDIQTNILGRSMNPNLGAIVESFYVKQLKELKAKAGKATEAREAKGDHTILRFVSGDREVIGRKDGEPLYAPPGTTLYADITDSKPRVYTDLATLLVNRRGLTLDEARVQSETYRGVKAVSTPEGGTRLVSPQEDLLNAITAFNGDRDLNKLLAVLRSYHQKPDAPAAPAVKAPEKAYAATEGQAPLYKDGQVAVLIHKQTKEVRTPQSVERAKLGGTVDKFLGVRFKPDDFELVYMPENVSFNDRRRRAEQALLERDAKVAKDLMANRASSTAPTEALSDPGLLPQSLSAERFSRTVFRPANDVEAEQIANALIVAKATNLGQSSAGNDAGALKAHIIREGLSGTHLAEAFDSLDLANPKMATGFDPLKVPYLGWPKNFNEFSARVEALNTLASAIEKVAPVGYARSTLTPTQTIDHALKTLNSYSSKTKKQIVKDLEIMLTGRTIGPDIIEGGEKQAYNYRSGLITLAEDTTGSSNFPRVSLLHELGHFAYTHFLTPTERVDAWRALSQFYGPDGKLDKAAIRATTPSPKTISNALLHPQELWANLFARAATEKVNMTPETAGVLKKLAQYVKAILDWMLHRKPIDPNLLPTLSKMLPPDDAATRSSAPPPNTTNPPKPRFNTPDEMAADMQLYMAASASDPKKMQSAIERNFDYLGEIRAKWDNAIADGNPDSLFDAAEFTTSFLGWSFQSRDRGGPEVSFLPYMRDANKGFGKASFRAADGSLHPIGRDRISDINKIITQTKEAVADLKDTDPVFARNAVEWNTRSIDQKERIAAQLTQLYYTGHAAAPDAAVKYEGRLAGKYSGDSNPTSMSGLLNMMENRLEAFYVRIVGRDANTVPASIAPKVPDGPVAAAVTQQIKAALADPEKKRMRVLGERPTLKELDSVAGMSKADLTTLLSGVIDNDKLARPVLHEIIAKEAAVPNKPIPPAGTPDEELFALGRWKNDDLQRAYMESIVDDPEGKRGLYQYEILRRLSKEDQSAAIPAPNAEKEIATEVSDNKGKSRQPGVPANARPSVVEPLMATTHRDPEQQATARKLAYRFMNIMGRTERGGPQFSTLDAARIMDMQLVDPLADAALETKSEAFKAFRKEMRSLSAALAKKEADGPNTAVERVVSMVVRTLPDEQRGILADGGITPDRITQHINDLLGLKEVITNAKQVNVLQTVIDKTAYILNGVIREPSARKTSSRLFVHGDMTDSGVRRPLSSRFGEGAVPSDFAPDFADELMTTLPPSYRESVSAFTSGNTTPYYIPSVSEVSVTNGNLGPGVYLSSTPAPLTPKAAKVATQAEAEEMLVLLQKRDDYADRAKNAIMDGGDATPFLDGFAVTDDLLKKFGVEKNVALPVYANIKATAKLDGGTIIHASDEFVGLLMNKMVETKALTPSAVTHVISEMGDTTSGWEFANLVAQAASEKGRGKQSVVKALQELGYDSVSSGPTGDARLLVFDADRVAHIADNRFLEDSIPTHTDGVGTNGQLFASIMDSEGDMPGSLSAISDELEFRLNKSGEPNVLSRALQAIGRRRTPTEDEAVDIHKAWAMQLSSQSARMAKANFHWLSDFSKTIFPRFNEKLDGVLNDPRTGLLTQLNALTGEGSAKRWLRKASAGYVDSEGRQKTHAKILAALRRASGSAEERALKPEERKAYLSIRDKMRSAFNELRATGVHIKDRGADYFPQVWAKDAIERNPERFKAGLVEYYMIEQRAVGENPTDAAAAKFADSVFLRLTHDSADPTLIDQMGASLGRGTSGENVDHSRVISLDRYPQALEMLEPFLEQDLEATIVKYMAQTTRRQLFVEKFGNLNRGVYDYLSVAAGGADEIAEMLQKRMVFRRKTKFFSDGQVYDRTDQLDFRMPFEERPDLARDFTEKLIEAHEKAGSPAALSMLNNLGRMSDGTTPKELSARFEAIVGALDDFNGKKAMVDGAEFDFAEKAIRTFAGHSVSSEQQALVSTSQALRTFNSVTLLGFTVLSSFGDLVLPLIRGGEMRAYTRAMRNFATDPDYRRMFQGVGLTMDSILHEHMTHLQGSSTGRIGNAFFQLNGLTPWTSMTRKIAGAVGLETFKTMQSKALRAFDPAKEVENQRPEFRRAYRFLANYGLGEYAMKPAEMSQDSLLKDATLRTALIRFADEAVFTPNPNDIPLWAQTPVGAIIAQLKSFPLMMSRLARSVGEDAALWLDPKRKHIGKVAREDANERILPAVYLAAFAPAFGAASLGARDLIQGRGGEDNREHDWRRRNVAGWLGEKDDGSPGTIAGWYLEGLMVAGGLGLLADLLHQTAKSVDDGAFGQVRILSALFGPSVSAVADTVNVAGGIVNAMGEEDSNSKERAAIRAVLGKVPIAGGFTSGRENLVDWFAGEREQ